MVRLGKGRRAAPRALLGGKAASLDWLERLGFPCPAAVCVTAAAYEAFLAEHGLHDVVLKLLRRLPDAGARLELEALYDSFALPVAVADGLETATRWLAASAPVGLAIRSSAPDEDSPTASFAGQHATFLGVAAGEVELRVRACWASLWSETAVAYRLARGLRFEISRMAVVLQPLVPAVVSAVAFSANPTTGRTDEVVVCTVAGLGEPLVSGKVVPDTVVLDKATLEPKEVARAEKSLALVADSVGVRYVTKVDDELCVEEAALVELVRLAIAVERASGRPMDVEAAYAGGRWLLLQARPITAWAGA